METKIIHTKPSDAGFQLFEELPRLIYPEGSLRFRETENINTDFLNACFVLLVNEVPQARAALYFNPGLAYKGMKTACVGNYECVDDRLIASQLIEFVVSEAWQNGAEFLIGPMNGSTWDNYRFSTHHDQPGFLLEPHHPLYYNQQFTDSGFKEISHYISSKDKVLKCDYPDVLKKEKELADAGVAIREIDLSDFEGELKKLYPLVISAFSDNFLYTQVDWETFRKKYMQAAQIISQEYVLIAEDREGNPIGFIFCYDDLYNQREKSLVVKTIARDSDKKWTGLGQVMANRILRLLKEKNYQSLIHAFMIQDGTSIPASRKFHGAHYKNYALYGKKISNQAILSSSVMDIF